jgi:hypothetical protein
MADKPLNVNEAARIVAAQGPGSAQLEVSFESSAVVLGAGELLNVGGVSYVFAYGGGAVSCYDTPGGAAVLLADRAGTAVSVTTAQLIEVRGVRYISFASAATVVLTG